MAQWQPLLLAVLLSCSNRELEMEPVHTFCEKVAGVSVDVEEVDVLVVGAGEAPKTMV
jgi:hypothetical protein